MLCAKSGHTRDHWVLSRGRPHLAVGQNRQGRIGKIDHYELRQEKTSHLHDEVHTHFQPKNSEGDAADAASPSASGPNNVGWLRKL